MVGHPLSHCGAMTFDPREKSVIETFSLYPGPGFQPPLPPATSGVTSSWQSGPCSIRKVWPSLGGRVMACGLRKP